MEPVQDAMEISVVIPTWNEESWLPVVLASIYRCPAISEVIVADNYSTDNTARIAADHQCIVIPGGRPAHGRNAGASVARGELIVFLDADVLVTADVIRTVLHHFRDKRVVGVHLPLDPMGGGSFVLLCYKVMERYLSLIHALGLSQVVGSFIAVRRDAFIETNGFDEMITAGEDADFLRRLRRLGSVVYDRESRVQVSPRRFRVENQYVFALKTIMWSVLRLMGSRASFVKYHWPGYATELAALDREWSLVNTDYVQRWPL